MLLDAVEVTTVEATVVWAVVTIRLATVIMCWVYCGLQGLGEPGPSNNHGHLRQ
jgi:hypothetical protein